MASYALLASESTVQVLSPTLVNDVVYCTIQTQPSEVIASIPVQATVFKSGTADVELQNFTDAIEQIMAMPSVVAATGQQSIDRNGLLADNVTFTVQYTPSSATPTNVTAEAIVPVGKLNFTDALIGQTLLQQVEAIINAVYNDLKTAAGG